MSFQYSILTAEQRKQALTQRILQLEADHFAHEMNKCTAESLPDEDPGKASSIESALSAQATLEGAILACRAELTA